MCWRPNFYRALHHSAKRGIAIACRLSVRLSVCLSVCNVGGSGPHRLEILETNCMVNKPNTFALRSPKAIHLLPEEHGEILGRLVAYWSTKAAISMKRVKIDEKLLWMTYKNSPTLSRTVPPRPLRCAGCSQAYLRVQWSARSVSEPRKTCVADALFLCGSWASCNWQVTDIWCDHLTKLVRVVVCGQIVPDVEPYKRDKRNDVIENQCLG